MIELYGKYNDCKIFADNVGQETIGQLHELLGQEFVRGERIRIMPDTHAGKGCVIGTTMTVTSKVVPNLVGVDISCGMLCCRIREKDVDLERFDQTMHHDIKSGFDIHDEARPYADKVDLSVLKCADRVQVDKARRSMGSIGSGNHFVEIDRDDEGNLYIVIHCGSRHLGLEVCDHYQDLAYKRLNGSTDEDAKALIAEYKATGRQREIEGAVKELKSVKRTNVPKDLCYLEGQDFGDYIHDMKILQEFAYWNRKQVLDDLLELNGLHSEDEFTTLHNYVDTDNMILRKGAISAQKDEVVLIPMNMRDGSLICIGKGNEDWNCSAPHGAGRLMSRGKAKKTVDMEEYRKSMEGIYTTCVNPSTADESPMAYKPMDEIIENMRDTVDVAKVIKPIYNFKASE